MEWVQAMNNFKNGAEEIVLNEIIYVQEVLNMVNFREINDDDILKEWLAFREDTLLCQLSDEDYKHGLNFDKFCERILRNVSKDNMQFVQSQFDKLYDDFMRYLDYWNEKYYRNGFVDGVQLISRNLNN